MERKRKIILPQKAETWFSVFLLLDAEVSCLQPNLSCVSAGTWSTVFRLIWTITCPPSWTTQRNTTHRGLRLVNQHTFVILSILLLQHFEKDLLAWYLRRCWQFYFHVCDFWIFFFFFLPWALCAENLTWQTFCWGKTLVRRLAGEPHGIRAGYHSKFFNTLPISILWFWYRFQSDAFLP